MHYIDAGIRLTGEELNDLAFVMTSLRTCNQFLNQRMNANVTEEQAREYYKGVYDAFVEAKINEHLWRLSIVEKYKVPYSFEILKGTLCIDEDED